MFPKCPDNHKWYKCKHEELAHPIIGSILMSVGVFHIFVGGYYLVIG